MNTKPAQYYIDQEKMVDVRIDLWSHNRMHVSFYNDRNDTCIGYTCSREELRGLADFLYKTLGEEKSWVHTKPITGIDENGQPIFTDSWEKK